MRENMKKSKDCIFPQGKDLLIQNELYSNECLRTREHIDSDFPYFHPGHCIF